MNISPLLYPILFFGFLCCLVIGESIVLSGNNIIQKENGLKSLFKCWIIVVLITLFIGFRPIHWIFVDTVNYAGFFERAQLLGYVDDSNNPRNEPIWIWIMMFFVNSGLTVNDWFAFITFASMVTLIYSCKYFFPSHPVLVLLFVMTGFAFFAGLVNGIRNNLAIHVFLLGFSIFIYHKSKFNIILLLLLVLISYLIHNSVIILMVAFVCSLIFIKSTKYAVFFWLSAIVATILIGPSLGQYISELTEDERAIGYMAEGIENIIEDSPHFRFDFLLYSVVPIILGWYVTVTRGIKDSKYQLLLNTYIIANAIWILFMYAAFTNRYAALSWSLYGIIILYPFVKFKLWRRPAYVASLFLWGQLAFYAYMLFK